MADKPGHPFPIVGIGASAGGLQALESFLANVPEGSGMAFVIVQHQDPTHEGALVELLQRGTAMPVAQVKDRMSIKPDSVYVIPPNKDMSILHGILHLLDPVAPRGLRLPIDFFFRALADDQRQHSIGVILSGMGSDGTLGLRAIKEKAGVVFVQEAGSAKFEGMPRSAINAGLADVIAPVEALPGKISDYLQHMPLSSKPGHPDQYTPQIALEKIVVLLRTQTGHDFSLYKNSTILRRIERRRGLHQIAELADYVRFLQQNPQEMELLFHELLIGVTSFFRDPEAWEKLKAEVLPELIAGFTSNKALRAWVPACSTGEEAYSLAILLRETMEELVPAKNITLQIFATDLDQQAIERAREGVFPLNIAADVSTERLDRFFVTLESGYQVAQSIRDMVVFAPQNIVMDPPFNKLDLLSCRNLLIYLTTESQEKLLRLLHYSLNPGGILFLGNAETVGNFANLFEPLDRSSRLYRRLDSALPAEPIEIPVAFATTKPGTRAKRIDASANLQTLADQLLLQRYSPAAALTNDKGDILYINGRTGKYLEPPHGKANWNIIAMAREGLRGELLQGLKKALRQMETVTLRNVVVVTNGGKQMVNVTVQPLSEPNGLHGSVIFVFHDVAELPQRKKTGKLRGHKAREAELERELELEFEQSRQELLTMREQMQSWEEELKSANEELQSANEEMQSTNEELTTSKEELQSMNEELHTVNQELKNRLDELSRTENDMKNLLDSTKIATLFLDDNLCVRRFTDAICKLTNLIPGDVGRPIIDIASTLLYPELADDAREVLGTYGTVEREISTTEGSWFAARILPYWTMQNIVDGVVITFMDITSSKKLEGELRTAGALLQERLDQKE
jgi:two-component system CheB/CheR fusion protein